MSSFKRVGLIVISLKAMHTPIQFDRHTSRGEWKDSEPQFGTGLTGKGQFATVVSKLSVAKTKIEANVIVVVYTNRCELGVVSRTTVIHTLDPLNLESFRLQARPGQGDF